MPALSTKAIVNAKPDPDKRLEIPDAACPGLRLVVFPSGAKSWIVRYRRTDKRTAKLTLGPFDPGAGIATPKIGHPMTLAMARRFAAEAILETKQGLDPGEKKVALRREEIAHRFGDLARRFIEEHAKPHTRRWQETARLLGLDIDLRLIPGGLAERWEAKPVSAIRSSDIVALLEECRTKTFPGAKRRRSADKVSSGMSRHMAAALSRLFSWIIGQALLPASPMAGLAKPSAPQSRARYLNDQEIKAYWLASVQMGYPFGDMFKLLLLTGQRLNEVATMRRADVSEDGIWTIEAGRAKTRRAHLVPMGPAARDLIAGIFANREDYVFTTLGTSPASGLSRAKDRLDRLMGDDVPPFRLHDIRRSVATKWAEAGIPIPVTEKMLNHLSGAGGGIVAVYQRFEYLPERRAAYEAWEETLQKIIEA